MKNVFRLPKAWIVMACCAALLVAFPASLMAKKPTFSTFFNDTPEQANDYLDRFQGSWIGTGDFDGSPIMDGLEIERILGDLYVQIRQEDLLGDFEAHMYFGFDAQDEQYELYVFGSFTGFGGNLPVRVMTGHRSSANVLVVEEAKEKGKDAAKEQLRYTFEFLDDDSFILSKTWVTGKSGKDKPFVVELFERN